MSVVLEHEEIGEAQRALQVLQSSCSAPIHLTSTPGMEPWSGMHGLYGHPDIGG